MGSRVFLGSGATLQLIAFGTYFFREKRVHGGQRGAQLGWSVD